MARWLDGSMARWLKAIAAMVLFASSQLSADDIPRMLDGSPYLSGTYDITTATPVEHRQEFGNQRALSAAQAEQLVARMVAFEKRGRAGLSFTFV